MHTFLTITSSVFSEVVVVYPDHEFHGLPSAVNKLSNHIPYITHLQAIHEMNKVRAFQAVLCVDVGDRVVVDAVQALEQAVAEYQKIAGPGIFSSEPLVISRLRRSSSRHTEEGCGSNY